jgi:hypothetical protein
MATDPSRMITSAITVPDAIEPVTGLGSESPVQSLKRRQSSVSESDSKRPRVSTDGYVQRSKESPVDNDRRSARRQGGQLEERKRGQRLFGALLGTLSQSSSSTAQKRRADIEKRQQAKLKQQAEEVSQRQHQQLEELTTTRRQVQKKYDEQSVSFAVSFPYDQD